MIVIVTDDAANVLLEWRGYADNISDALNKALDKRDEEYQKEQEL